MNTETKKLPIPASDGYICPVCGEVKKFGSKEVNCTKCGNEMLLCAKEKSISLGDKFYWVYSEFDGSGIIEGSVVKIFHDHFLLMPKDDPDMQLYFTYDQIDNDVFYSWNKAEEYLNQL